MRTSLNLPHKSEIPELVVSAAIQFHKEDGSKVIVPSVRHFDKLTHVLLEELGHTVNSHVYEQGFVTNRYRFIDRTEAKTIAEENGQMLREEYSKELYSEKSLLNFFV